MELKKDLDNELMTDEMSMEVIENLNVEELESRYEYSDIYICNYTWIL